MVVNIWIHGNNLDIQFVQCVRLKIFLKLKNDTIFYSRGYDSNLYMVYSNLLSSSMFWLLSTLIVVAGLLPDLFFKALEALNLKFRTVFPGNETMGTKKVGPKLVQSTYL